MAKRALLFTIISLFAAAVYAAGEGDQCRFPNPFDEDYQKYQCASNKRCLRAISKWYCSDSSKTCGWRDTGGFDVGDEKTWKGKHYRCQVNGFTKIQSSPQASVPSPSDDIGKECKFPNPYLIGTSQFLQYQCSNDLVCLQAINKQYCSLQGRVCGWPNKSGFYLGEQAIWNEKRYACYGNGFQKMESETVDLGFTKVPMSPQTRNLSGAEQRLASRVFGESLDLSRVNANNTTGLADSRPWTTNLGVYFTINIGAAAYPNLIATRKLAKTMLHELTHVWQGQHGMEFMSNSLYHQTLGATMSGKSAYSFEVGEQWSEYNAEQQGEIVEKWYLKDYMSTSSDLFPYIRDNIRPGAPNAETSFSKPKNR